MPNQAARSWSLPGGLVVLCHLLVSPCVYLQCRVQTTDYRLQTTDYRLQTTDYRLQTTDYRLQTTDYRLQTTNYSVDNTILSNLPIWGEAARRLAPSSLRKRGDIVLHLLLLQLKKNYNSLLALNDMMKRICTVHYVHWKTVLAMIGAHTREVENIGFFSDQNI